MANLTNEQIDKIVGNFCDGFSDTIYNPRLFSMAIKEYVLRTRRNFDVIDSLNKKLKRELNKAKDHSLDDLGKKLSSELVKVRGEIRKCEHERRHALKDIVALDNRIDRIEEAIIKMFNLDKNSLKELLKSRARHV